MKILFAILLPTVSQAIHCDDGLKIREYTSQCYDRSLLKKPDPKSPRTALASLPGSGRNWIDHLIEMSTGTQTSGKSWTSGDALPFVTLDHFLDQYPEFFDKAYRGPQIKIGYSYQSFYQHRHYENIIVIYRDPIFRAMSPSNNLKRDVSYNEAKFNSEYFEYHFVKDLETIIPAWKDWFERILKINSKFCLVNYDKLKTNVIEELRPVVNFLGFDINEELAKCILINQEGANHRPEKSKDEINRILSFIPPDDLYRYSKMKEDVLQMLKNASSC